MNLKWGKLRETWFGEHQRDPSRVPSKGSKVDTWLGVMQFVLGSSDSSIDKNFRVDARNWSLNLK